MNYFLHNESVVTVAQILECYDVYDVENLIVAHAGAIEKFSTRAEAHRANADHTRTITFWLSGDAKNAWRDREWARFSDGTYAKTPWANTSWYRYQDVFSLHHCHMSLKHIGSVAYTADQESGYLDKQIVTTPGRYLQKFASAFLTADQMNAYVAQVKNFDGKFKIATTSEEIFRAYIHGPSSCMSREHNDHNENPWASGVHPVRAYGNSDLALAYLGNLEGVSARSIVWPERKIFTRVYGNDSASMALLKSALQNDGYKYSDDTEGAKIPAMPIDGQSQAYVMPYVDSADSARLVRGADGKRYFVLDNDGPYSVRNTDGTTGEIEDDSQTCEHCGDRYDDSDYGEYCQHCGDNRWVCDHCDEVSFQPNRQVDAGTQTLCRSCAAELGSECRECQEQFFESSFSRSQRQSRESRGVTDYCADCSDGKTICQDCSDDVLIDEDCERCEACEEIEKQNAIDAEQNPALPGLASEDETAF